MKTDVIVLTRSRQPLDLIKKVLKVLLIFGMAILSLSMVWLVMFRY